MYFLFWENFLLWKTKNCSSFINTSSILKKQTNKKNHVADTGYDAPNKRQRSLAHLELVFPGSQKTRKISVCAQYPAHWMLKRCFGERKQAEICGHLEEGCILKKDIMETNPH
jgi:hypothetical protein